MCEVESDVKSRLVIWTIDLDTELGLDGARQGLPWAMQGHAGILESMRV